MAPPAPAPSRPYVGRFAPSPSGPLHAGSLATALASWLDARAHGGRWLVRIEDVDAQRCDARWVPVILQQLARCGLEPDEAPVWQSHRGAFYESALAHLASDGQTYACDCSRSDIRAALLESGAQQPLSEGGETPYPGMCRHRGLTAAPGRAIRLRCGSGRDPLLINWNDRRLGPQHQNVTQSVGDFVLKRRDGLWAYQLAVVVDDAAQGITHVVRGEDLTSNTARQVHLQTLLNYPRLSYLHTPLVLDEQHRKLSKHTGAPAVTICSTPDAQIALREATKTLGLLLPPELWERGDIAHILESAVIAWLQSSPG